MIGIQEVNPPISRSEAVDYGVLEVRQAHSSDETAAMASDAKGPDFCNAPSEGWGSPSLRKGSRTWA